MTQSQVIALEHSAPVKRTADSIVYRRKELGVPFLMLFEFTKGRLDQVSYVMDAPSQNAENAFLQWCLALTKRYGQGILYLDKKPIGRPGVMMEQALKQFWTKPNGEILVVYSAIARALVSTSDPFLSAA